MQREVFLYHKKTSPRLEGLRILNRKRIKILPAVQRNKPAGGRKPDI